MPVRKNREAEIAVIRPAQPRSTLRAVVGATERRLSGAMEIPLEQVVHDPDQPRRDWEHHDGLQHLQELAASIREFGILQPLLVREDGIIADGRQRYVIIAGARRHAAANRIGLTTVPVIIRDGEATQVRVLQLIENVQRQDLSPLDEARAYQELMDTEDISPPMLAALLHLSPQHVRDRLRLMSDQVLADAVERGQISATAARDILQLPENEKDSLRDQIRSGGAVQTTDVAMIRRKLAAKGVVNPRRKQKDTKKQTPFVSSGTSASSGVTAQVDAVETPVHIAGTSLPLSYAGETQQREMWEQRGNEAGQLTLLATHIGGIIDRHLSGDARTQFAAMLEATREDTSVAVQWWLIVDAYLRVQCGK